MIISSQMFDFIFIDYVISFSLLLLAIPTLYQIYMNKSTQGCNSMPYSMALFNCMLLFYLDYLKPENDYIVTSINYIDCVIQIAYLFAFLIYATNDSRVSTIKLLVFFNGLSFGLMMVTTLLVTNPGTERATAIEWICTIFSFCLLVDPVNLMIEVIKTKSTKDISFTVSLYKAICAMILVVKGLLIKEYLEATQKALDFLVEIAQVILFLIYKDNVPHARTN